MTPQQETNLGQAMMAYDSKHGGHESKMPPSARHKRSDSQTKLEVLKRVTEGGEDGYLITEIVDNINSSHSTVRNNLYLLRTEGRVKSKYRGKYVAWSLVKAGGDAQAEMRGL